MFVRKIALIICLSITAVGFCVARESQFQKYSQSISENSEGPIQTVININNLTVWVRGDGFHDWVIDGSWNGTFPKGTAGFIFTEGIIWGGFVNDGSLPELRVGGSTYQSGCQAGAIITDGSGNVVGVEDPSDPMVRPYRVRKNWDTADLTDDAANYFLVTPDSVTENQIEDIRNQYNLDWNEWPWEKGAPFEDINKDGIYSPNIDIPGIPGADQTMWIVYNDLDPVMTDDLYGSPPIGLEIQETYWAYRHKFVNTVFKKIRFIYKGKIGTSSDVTIDSMYIAQWSDPDNGYYNDDFVGYDSALSLGYVYNGNEIDETWDYLGYVPPAAGYHMLQGPIIFTGEASHQAYFDFERINGYQNIPLSSFTFFGTGTPRSDPNLGDYTGTLGWYNMMRGCELLPRYPSCTRLLDENGIPTNFEVSGDPVQGTGDLDGQPTSDNPNRWPEGDRRLFMASGPFSMNRGDVQEVVIGLTAGMGQDYLSSITVLRYHVKLVDENWQQDVSLNSFSNSSLLISSDYKLHQNYPNPFNPVTTIEFFITKSGSVTLDVYDISGRKVETILDKRMDKGSHKVQWNASDYSSGIYFVRLVSGSFHQTRKMVLLQ